jgi:hypothetical protein
VTDKKLSPPKKSKGDAVHTVARAGLSALPVIGGPAVELLQAVIQPPLEKRREAWMEDVGTKLHELEERGLKIEDLQNNEQFISAVLYASQLALRTHRQEKLDALRNAVLNIASGQAPEEALQHIFLNMVDSLTVLHIQVLKVFQAPNPPEHMSMGGLSNVLEHSMPALRGRRGLYDQIWKDLFTRGLVNTEHLHMTMTGSGLASKRTTELADMFLDFIS